MPWVIFARAPPPEVVVWPGRRGLALIDALAWPWAWANFVIGMPVPLGLAGQCALACCAVAALQRAYRAMVQNHRYHFTTWRWGRWLAFALAFGYALKFVVWIIA